MTGYELQTLRQQAGMPRRRLARLLHVDDSTIARWERAKDQPIPSEAAAVVKKHVDTFYAEQPDLS